MIYDFSLASMYEFTGVDTAMCLRAKLLSEEGYDIKAIFVQVPTCCDLEMYLELGLEYDQLMVMHSNFTDMPDIQPKVKPCDIIEELKLSLNFSKVLHENGKVYFVEEKEIVAIANLTKDEEFVYSIEHYKNGYLVRTDLYSETLYCSSFFKPKERNGVLFADLRERVFYNRNGSIAFFENMYNDKPYYVFSDGSRYNRDQLFNLFVEKLNLRKNDTVLLDRPRTLFSAKPLFERYEQTNIVAVVHSEHFFEKGFSTLGEYLNQEYWYWFKNSKYIHTMVVSTKEQKEGLEKTLKKYNLKMPEIKVIPAFCVNELKYAIEPRKKKSIVCVSRLQKGKKIEWAIWAAIKAHKMDGEITLDIYGEGDPQYEAHLESIIIEQNASDYITLKGFMNVEDVYKGYELYISTSLTESFGITLLEAAASGLPMIGFDVRYGNRLFIESNKNGYLIPYNPEHFREKCPFETEIMALRMVDLLSDTDRLAMFSKRSYEISERFLSNHIKKKWCDLIEEQTRTIERN